MIDASQLLPDLQRLLKKLEAALRRRCEESAEVNARVQANYVGAKGQPHVAVVFSMA